MTVKPTGILFCLNARVLSSLMLIILLQSMPRPPLGISKHTLLIHYIVIKGCSFVLCVVVLLNKNLKNLLPHVLKYFWHMEKEYLRPWPSTGLPFPSLPGLMFYPLLLLSRGILPLLTLTSSSRAHHLISQGGHQKRLRLLTACKANALIMRLTILLSITHN